MFEKHHYRRASIASIWVAIFGLLLIQFVGLAMDTSLIGLTANQLQNTADAAALAGAMKVRATIAEANALAIATAAANFAVNESVQLAANLENLETGDIVVGHWSRTDALFTPFVVGGTNTLSTNAVQVTARRTDTSLNGALPLVFGKVFNVDTYNIARSAIAMIGGGTGSGIITLADTGCCSLQFDGTIDLIIDTADGCVDPDGQPCEGAIQVNSDGTGENCTGGNAGCGVCGGGNLLVEADEMNIVSEDCWNGNPDINIDPINDYQDYVPDPLASIPPPIPEQGIPAPEPYPVPEGTIDLGEIDDVSGTYGPGYYSGGLRATSAGTTITLLPGVYIMDNIDGGPESGLYVNGGNLIANEVLIYVVGQGVVFLAGNGIIDITPSSDEDDIYWGISIWQSRDNQNPATILGGANMNLEGTLYFPVAPLELGGTGIAVGNQLIAWDLWIHGTGTFNINYDGRYPAPGTKVFLVF